jgi:hypothetical protein
MTPRRGKQIALAVLLLDVLAILVAVTALIYGWRLAWSGFEIPIS